MGVPTSSTMTESFALWATEGRECRLSLLRTGTQVTIVVGGRPLYSRIFECGQDALVWAAEERANCSAPKDRLNDAREDSDGEGPK
jgi:hypothetical protein